MGSAIDEELEEALGDAWLAFPTGAMGEAASGRTCSPGAKGFEGGVEVAIARAEIDSMVDWTSSERDT